MALGAGVTAGVRHELAWPPTTAALRAVLYLALVATCLGFLVQAWAQSTLTATRAAVIITSERLFAAVIATALGGETMTPLT